MALTTGNKIAIIAALVALIGLFLTYWIFKTQRCDDAVNEALDYHTSNRDSTISAIEASVAAKFGIAAERCGPNPTLRKVLHDWYIMPGRCEGDKPPRGKETCDETLRILGALE